MVHSKTITILVNLGHSLLKSGQFKTKVDTSGGSASIISSDALEIKTYPSCTIYCLKHIIYE